MSPHFLRSSRQRRGALALVFAALLGPWFLVGCNNEPIFVSTKIFRITTNSCVILVTIANNSGKDLEFNENDLPWSLPGEAMRLALIEQDSANREAIPRTPIILDPPVGLPLILRRREMKSGEIHLDAYYNSLIPALQRHDVTVSWEYTPRPRNATGFKPVTGSLRLPRLK